MSLGNSAMVNWHYIERKDRKNKEVISRLEIVHGGVVNALGLKYIGARWVLSLAYANRIISNCGGWLYN